jgi:hypothetical protein
MPVQRFPDRNDIMNTIHVGVVSAEESIFSEAVLALPGEAN